MTFVGLSRHCGRTAETTRRLREDSSCPGGEVLSSWSRDQGGGDSAQKEGGRGTQEERGRGETERGREKERGREEEKGGTKAERAGETETERRRG